MESLEYLLKKEHFSEKKRFPPFKTHLSESRRAKYILVVAGRLVVLTLQLQMFLTMIFYCHASLTQRTLFGSLYIFGERQLFALSQMNIFVFSTTARVENELEHQPIQSLLEQELFISLMFLSLQPFSLDSTKRLNQGKSL